MSVVQTSAVNNTQGNGVNQPGLSGVVAGNLVVLTVGWAQLGNGNPPTVSGWTAAENPAGQIFLGAVWVGSAIFYKENSAGGTEQPSVTPATGASSCAMSAVLQEHNGFPTSGTLGVHTNNSGASGTSGDTGTTGATSVANALVVAAHCGIDVTGVSHANAGISTPASTGYTSAGVHQDNTATGTPFESSYKYVSATGTQTASWTWTDSSAHQGVIATFYQSAPPPVEATLIMPPMMPPAGARR